VSYDLVSDLLGPEEQDVHGSIEAAKSASVEIVIVEFDLDLSPQQLLHEIARRGPVGPLGTHSI
jgi:hypothetical protein